MHPAARRGPHRLPSTERLICIPLWNLETLRGFDAFINSDVVVVDMKASTTAREDGEVVASVDDAGSGREYVIADITEDGAWVAIDASDAPTLPAWR